MEPTWKCRPWWALKCAFHPLVVIETGNSCVGVWVNNEHAVSCRKLGTRGGRCTTLWRRRQSNWTEVKWCGVLTSVEPGLPCIWTIYVAVTSNRKPDVWEFYTMKISMVSLKSITEKAENRKGIQLAYYGMPAFNALPMIRAYNYSVLEIWQSVSVLIFFGQLVIYNFVYHLPREKWQFISKRLLHGCYKVATRNFSSS